MNRPALSLNGALGLALGLAAGCVLAPEPLEAQYVAETPMCVSCHPGSDLGWMSALEHGESTTCLTCHHIGYSNDPAVVAARRLDACEACHDDLRPAHGAVAANSPACTECHTIHADPDVTGPGLVVDGACASCHEGGHSLHGTVADAPRCTACHAAHGAAAVVMEEPHVSRSCVTCHDAAHPSHAGVEGGLSCTQCHGVNARPAVAGVDVLLSQACTSCHESLQPTHEAAGEDAPLCVDCHDFGEDPVTALAGPAVSRRCGSCHTERLAELDSGGHAEGVAASDPNTDLPNCMTCHMAHTHPSSRSADVRLSATVRCIECHSQGALIERYGLPENVVASYVDDYHGATVEFLWNHPAGEDQPRVMVCSDCHGAHAVGWDPEHAVADVCMDCHERGDQQLAGAWLGHDRVGPRNQVVVWLIRLFYYVLIPFVLGGLFLNIVIHLGHERRHGARMGKTPKVTRLRAWLSGRRPPKPATVTRFTRLERTEHLAAMLAFTLLVVTGLPQTASSSSLANVIVDFFGGIGSTRLLHRVAGFSFVALMVLHVARGVVGTVRRRKLPEIVPRQRDFRSLLQTVRHILTGAPKPKIGKFDAAAKFEYWGLFLGGTLMSVTGVVLVFPELVSQLVPGIVVTAMRVMHGLEATFAVLVVLLWHSWSVIFRPDVFPLDTSMFTGEIEVDRLKEEHALEYERIVAEGGMAEAD